MNCQCWVTGICGECEGAINAQALAAHPYTPLLELLCQSIPSLRGLQGTKPWNPPLLAKRYGTASSGERACIAFALYVWNRHANEWEHWNIPPFTLADFERLDDDNQAGIVAWFAKPFWP